LNQQQFHAFVDRTKMEGKVYYRVHAGSFRDRKQAEKVLAQLEKMGLGKPFITVGSVPYENGEGGMPILGENRLNAKQLDRYARYVNPDAPNLGSYYIEFGRHYGVRGDMAFAQALIETDDFRFSGTDNPEQYNYCRLCAAGAEDPGHSFPTPQSGVLAHVQHLYGHASGAPLPEGHPLTDPCHPERKGTAKTWSALSRDRNKRENDYGGEIMSKYEEIVEFAAKNKPRAPCAFIVTARNLMRRWFCDDQ
jgi:N-acetylmuramoyl-L-alanine amidase